MTINELENIIKTKEPNICQISIFKKGIEIYSKEFNGYKKADCTHIMSATKSIFSLLIGIAIDKKYINSVNDKVISYFPDYIPKKGEKTIYDVEIKDLLTMRAPYKGKGDPWSKVCSSDDWTKTSLDYLGGRKGKTMQFDYRTVCLHILSGLFFNASKISPLEFANEELFKPLDIPIHKIFYAEDKDEHVHFTIDKGPKDNIWFCDPSNLPTPGYGLCMSAFDMAKIGQLSLNEGLWNNKRIISNEWIKEMTIPREIENDMFRGMQYGYLWWIIHKDDNIYAAIGNSGNVIYVNPKDEIVIAISSYFNPRIFDRIDFIEDTILPLFI